MKQRFWKRYGFAYLAISPFFIQFLIFQLVPTIATFYYSFTNWNGMKEPRWIGWSNYAMMLEDYQFIDSLRNTALYWVVGVMGVLCLSLMIASLLNSQALRFKSFFKPSPFCPMYAPPWPWV